MISKCCLYTVNPVLKGIIGYSDFLFEIVILESLETNRICFFLTPHIYVAKQFVWMHLCTTDNFIYNYLVICDFIDKLFCQRFFIIFRKWLC